MMHPITLTISTGRCGTTYLEKTLKKSSVGQFPNAWIEHEFLGPEVAKPNQYHRSFKEAEYQQLFSSKVVDLLSTWRKISEHSPVVDFGWTMRSLIPGIFDRIGEQLKIVFLHRHPISVAGSFANMGAYCDNASRWKLNPFHPNARYKNFADRWPSMSPFEKCLYMWLEVNAYGVEAREKFPNFIEVKSSDLFSSEAAVKRIFEHCGFDGIELAVQTERNGLTTFSNEHRPIKNEWKRHRLHVEVHELAEQLGYDMSDDAVEQNIAKYQLPKRLPAFVRHYSGYWPIKKLIGRQFRKLGLLKPNGH